MTLSAQLAHFGIHAVDLDQPNDTILATTEAMCRSRPRFMTREAWMQSIQAKLDARQSSPGARHSVAHSSFGQAEERHEVARSR